MKNIEPKKETDVEDLLFRKKPVKLFAAMTKGEDDTRYVSVLAKKTDCTYSHTVKLLEQLKNLGYVEFEKKGRIKYVSLTEDGKKLANALSNVIRIIHTQKK